MADSIPQLAWIAKADGFIYWYNKRWYEYTGTTPHQMDGWGWQSVHDPLCCRVFWCGGKPPIAPGEVERLKRGEAFQFRRKSIQRFKSTEI